MCERSIVPLHILLHSVIVMFRYFCSFTVGLLVWINVLILCLVVINYCMEKPQHDVELFNTGSLPYFLPVTWYVYATFYFLYKNMLVVEARVILALGHITPPL